MKRRERILELLRWLREPSASEPLGECSLCGSDAIALVDWREATDERWTLWLRCGECGRHREVLAEDDEVSELAAAFERQLEEIAVVLDALEHDRMVDDMLVLREALKRDLIEPDDFSRPPA